MNVFNNVTNSPISLNMGETKTITLNIPSYTKNVRLCYLRPGCTLDIITNLGNASGCYLLLQFPYGNTNITIKINGEIREILNNTSCLLLSPGDSLLQFSLTQISD